MVPGSEVLAPAPVPGFRRRRDEDDINDLESSPSRRKKICPTVDLTNEGGLVNMARGLKIGNGYFHRTSDTQFDPWIHSPQSSDPKHTQPFNRTAIQTGWAARYNGFNSPPTFPRTSISNPQTPQVRHWAIGYGQKPHASPPNTPRAHLLCSTITTSPLCLTSSPQRAVGRVQSLNSPLAITASRNRAQTPPPKTTSRVSPQRKVQHCKLGLESIVHNGHTLRERKTVELHDGTFLRIASIKSRISDHGEDEIFLEGPKFQRAREFLGLLALKKNEVALSSICETIPLSEVLKPRILIVTNANFPKYRDITGHDQVDEREGRLICRWRLNMVNKQEGYIWRLQDHEVDKEYRMDDSELREDWRGRLVKVVEMLQDGALKDNPPLPHKDLCEQEGFIEWSAKRRNFVDLTTSQPEKQKEGVKETHHTEIVANCSRIELKETSNSPYEQSDQPVTEGSSSYEATIDSRTPAGRFLGYFQGTYTPNSNTPPSFSSALHSTLGSGTQTPSSSIGSRGTWSPGTSAGNLNRWGPYQKFRAFRGSSFSPFNFSRGKQIYDISGRPLTHAEGSSQPPLFNKSAFTHLHTPQSNGYDNLKGSAPFSKHYPLGKSSNFTFSHGMFSPPPTPTKHGTPTKSVLPKNTTSPGGQSGSSSGMSEKSNSFRGFDDILKQPPPPQPVFTPVFSPNRRKYTFGDAFCGGGGMSSGARAAGLRNTWSFDFNMDAVSTYRKNFPDCETYHASASDFVAFPPEELLVDVVHLSPPCQPHSPAHTIAGKDDDRNEASLFCVKECLEASRPRMVTLEQTDGILNRQEWFRSLVMCFTDLGFSVSWKVLHGVEYGVPQTRKRLFLLAASPGEVLPNFPTPKHAHPKENRPVGRLPPRTVRNAISSIPWGSTCHDPLPFPNGFRPSPVDFDQPLKATILASGGPYDVHPSGLRPFTPRELACLQTFPVTHDFSGSTFQKKKQIGNAVPPALAEALLREVRRALEKADRERRSKQVVKECEKKAPEMVDMGKGKGLQTVIAIPDDEEGEVEIVQSGKQVVLVE